MNLFVNLRDFCLPAMPEELLPNGNISRILKHKTTDVIGKIRLSSAVVQWPFVRVYFFAKDSIKTITTI